MPCGALRCKRRVALLARLDGRPLVRAEGGYLIESAVARWPPRHDPSRGGATIAAWPDPFLNASRRRSSSPRPSVGFFTVSTSETPRWLSWGFGAFGSTAEAGADSAAEADAGTDAHADAAPGAGARGKGESANEPPGQALPSPITHTKATRRTKRGTPWRIQEARAQPSGFLLELGICCESSARWSLKWPSTLFIEQ